MLKNDINMLDGPLFKNIIKYTLPIIFTNILQLLFNAADLIVVGRFCGSVSVAAVGATTSLINLITNLFIGISIGTGVVAAMAIGSKNREDTEAVVHTAVPTAVISGIFLTVVGILFSEDILKLMGTPEDILPLSVQYMEIYFMGITAVMVYNFCTAILRAAGDTKSPLIFLIISGALNVVLNLVFVVIFDMNVAGVAIATTISQCLSAVLVLIALSKRNDFCRLEFKKIKIHTKALSRLLRIGIPAGIQSSLFSISNVLIQSSINSFGQIVVSGSSAAANIEGFVYTVMDSFQQTALNFTGQNVGIKNYKRVKKVFRTCLACTVTSGLILGSAVCIFGRQLLAIYITDSAAAIDRGMIRLLFICLPYFIVGLMNTTAGVLRGMGSSLPPMIITVLGVCVMRIVWIFTVFEIPAFHTLGGLYVSYPISWAITFIAELAVFELLYKRRVGEQRENQPA